MAKRIDMTPPATVARNAKRGLELREAFKRGGTHVGVARARQLSAREQLDPTDIRSMYSYFARHAVDKQARSRVWGDEDDPSAGYVAWMLWGGDAGREWAARIRDALNQ